MTRVELPLPVIFILQKLIEADFEAYVVGGAVRDLLQERETSDWDVTTNAKPEEIQALFNESFYDNAFGTVGVAGEHLLEQMQESGWEVPEELKEDEAWQKEVVEVTTFRKEYGYSDRRRPDHIEWGESIDDDLKRRDFTINAMALKVKSQKPKSKSQINVSIEAEVIDPFDGRADLEAGVIRAVGNPHERFAEDALRMMRAIRFGGQLGMVIEQQTLTAIQEQADLISEIAWERIRDEFLKMLASDYPADGIQLLHSAGLLKYVLPELLEAQGVEQGGRHEHDVWTHSIESLRHCHSTDPIVRLAALLHDIGKPRTARKGGPRGVTFYGHEVVGARMAKKIGQRLRLSNKQIDRLWTLVRWHMFQYEPEMTDAAIRRFIKRVGVENINDMILLRIGDRKGGGSRATSWRLREFQKRIGEQLYEPLSVKDLKVDGHDVMETLGIDPSPEIGRILNQLFEEVMEDTSKNTREYLMERMRELHESNG